MTSKLSMDYNLEDILEDLASVSEKEFFLYHEKLPHFAFNISDMLQSEQNQI